MHDRLKLLVGEMVDRGIRYEDAQREFERQFIVRVLAKCDGNLGRAATTLGVHRNTLSRKIHDLKIRLSSR
ncbi:MAG TPA: helix-turn-helix domain-containing protein [Vicinamibacterales bacterium]|nr:helix-turn-helix domain-containing protein [Vicinamibacterales bacterium]